MATQLNKTKEFIDRVVALVPEDQRDSVRSQYSAAQDEASSLDAAIARVNTTAKAQTEWYEANKTALEEYKANKGNGGGGAHTIDLKDVGKQIDGVKDEVMSQGLQLMTIGTSIAVGHIHEFGEALDMAKLTHDAIAAKKPLKEFYDESVASRRADKAKAEFDKQIATAREEGKKEGVTETLGKLPNAMPYPVGQSLGVSTLDGLKSVEGARNVVQDAAATAVAEMNRSHG